MGIRHQSTTDNKTLLERGVKLKNLLFIDSLPWFVGYFALCLALLLCCRP
ncbi:MAG: hypothetical protein GQ578_06865 [Desulfuromonadaceae bacterium]|nr:hypothetical protein [Desulfuromonadaceae bacterium]